MLTYVTVLSRTAPKSAEQSQTDENEDAAGDEQPLSYRRQKGTNQNHKKADDQQRDPEPPGRHKPWIGWSRGRIDDRRFKPCFDM
jgi:hypothetical protein